MVACNDLLNNLQKLLLKRQRHAKFIVRRHEDRNMERERLERRFEQAIWEHPHLIAIHASRYAPVVGTAAR